MSEIESFEEYLNSHLEPATASTYRSFIRKLPQDIDLVNQSEDSIIALVNQCLEANPHRVAFSCFRKFIKYKFDILEYTDPLLKEKIRRKKNNILSNLELPERHRRINPAEIRDSYLPAPELFKLLTALRESGEQQAFIIAVLQYDIGSRIKKELLQNDVKAVDFKNKEFFIPKELAKNDKSRTIPISMPETLSLLETWIESNGLKPNDKLFNLTYKQYWYRFTETSKAAGVKRKDGDSGCWPYCLRHSRLSDLAPETEMGQLQRFAGHSSPVITSSYIEASAGLHPQKLEDYMKEKGLSLL